MKVHLSQIPEEGLERRVRLALASLPRLREAIGEQPGELEATLLLKNREGSVEITGRLSATLQPPCQRCLEPVALPLEETVLVALVPQGEYDRVPEDLHLGAAELEVSFYEGETLELAAILEDELLLLVPETVAEEDEQGRCRICGRSSDELFPAEPASTADHPFSQLKRFIHEE
jgi:uncharacterized protein